MDMTPIKYSVANLKSASQDGLLDFLTFYDSDQAN